MKTQTLYEVRATVSNSNTAQAIMEEVAEEMGKILVADFYPNDDNYGGEIIWEHLSLDEYNDLLDLLDRY